MAISTIDFSLVADLERPSIWFGLPLDLEKALAALPETQARVEGTLHFAYRSNCDATTMLVMESKEQIFREAYFRAALGEFVSMEEAAILDFKNSGKTTMPPRANALSNPLFHVFREMRNVNFHLTRSRIQMSNRLATITLADQTHEVDYGLTLISGFDEPTFARLQNARNYRTSDIKALVEWFDLVQREWGAPHMLRLAVIAYANHLLTLFRSAV